MSRSLKKGPYVDERVLKKVQGKKPSDIQEPIRTWSRSCTIVPEMVGFTFAVHDGIKYPKVKIIEEMVGHRLGEFALTRTFRRHGGKIQKELEKKAQETEKAKLTSAQEKAKQ